MKRHILSFEEFVNEGFGSMKLPPALQKYADIIAEFDNEGSSSRPDYWLVLKRPYVSFSLETPTIHETTISAVISELKSAYKDEEYWKNM